MTITVLVVDDHPLYREGLITAIDTMAGKKIIGEAGDGDTAVRLAGEMLPDIIVMDLHMPGLNGVYATRAITEAHPGIAVLVLTMLEGDDSVFAAIRAGARGYLLKGADRAEIARALDTVAHGEVIFSASIASRVLAFFAGGTPGGGAVPFPELTDREREVLDLIARGLTNAAIARQLVVSDKTIRNHVSNVFAKMHVTGRAQAVARARDAGLGGR
jgi:DNA-binding NarL/FixJ family response regulator